MIQRKQTIFLALAALLSAASWFFPVSTMQLGEERYVFVTNGFVGPSGVLLEDPTPILPLHILHSVLAAAFIVAIFLYGNRPRQMRLVRGTFILMVAIVGGTFIIDHSFHAYLSARGTVDHSFGVSYFLPLLVLVLAILAQRSIQADEDLVKSMDRLR